VTVALLEFPGESAGALVFSDPVDTLVARSAEEVLPLLRMAESHAAAGRWCVGFVAYEAAPAFDMAMTTPGGDPPLPLAWFSVHESADAAEPSVAHDTQTVDWAPDVGEGEYAAAIRAIREGIAAGDFYQVNYTVRFATGALLDAGALYSRLRRVQPDAYAALIDTDDFTIVSASPELFFDLRGRELTMRPMKGTARRGRWAEEDDAAATALRESVKERAENVMIVDLIRNDIGRIALTGTVRVPALFEVERHPTVLQMTSTVIATLRPDVDLAGVFRALFPCGSVTGAPKIAAMAAIARHERSPRGVYCGAIGVVRPGGDSTFSVAIRTAWIDRRRGRTEYGSGGGITWDSLAAAELNEVRAKAAILVEERPPFSLLETIRLESGVAVREDAHLARLAASAAYFGFADPAAAARAAIARTAREHAQGIHRLRLTATPAPEVTIEVQPMPDSGEPLPVTLAARPVHRDNVFLHHKTTNRAVYDERLASAGDVFDVILVNEQGELTELTRGNLVVEIAGRRVTPPRDSGLLAGVFRGELLRRGEVVERTLTVDELGAATRLWMVNSLREWVELRLVPGGLPGGPQSASIAAHPLSG
jgi:para-aminobenzoate synthetase / 4-amino-4-deoxychorismate lyase